jgi:molybdopterin-biosynthesis enzyme MoeA-like protein
MGVFPLGAQIIPNPYNKIPGFSCYVEEGGSSIQQGPQNRFSRALRAAAPSGGEIPHEVSGGSSIQQGPRDWLRQTAGAAAPSGGSDPHAVGERGGMHPAAPSGGRALHEVSNRGGVHFFPGFPVMAWPMMAWVLDTHYAHLHQKLAYSEKSVIVFGSMEAMLTPLMLEIEAEHSRVKVFSLPSVDHAEYGRHIELGVKGPPDAVNLAYPALLAGLHRFDLKFGPELVR